jgi:hypothetical protein
LIWIINKKTSFFSCALAVFFLLPASFCSAGVQEEDYSIRFELPFGTGSYQTAVPKDSYVQALLSVESLVHRKADIQANIELPSCFEVVAGDGLTVNGNIIRAVFQLRTENDIWYRLIQLYVKPEATDGKYEIPLTIKCAGREITDRVSCWIAPAKYLEENIRLLRFSVPSNEEGKRDYKRQENTFLFKSINSKALRSVTLNKKSAHDFEFVSVELENVGAYPVTLSLNYLICDKVTKKPVDWLKDLGDEQQGSDMPGLYTQCLLMPHSKELVVFKILSQDTGMLPGEYIQKLDIGLFSSEKKLFSIERPLEVKEVNAAAVFSTVLALIISLVGITGTIMLRRFLFAGLTSREYILIGLYAAVAFSLVSVPATVIYNVFHTLLGPFSFLVTGIFSEIVFYLLLISLLVLLPRPGVVLCFVFVKFLLGAVILGDISILSVLWYPMLAVVLELALFLSGLYEKDFLGMDVSGHRRDVRHDFKKVIWAAFVFGLADAFLCYVSFNITIFFYRLFYAQWYLVACILISGFLYTFIAVPMGIKLGDRLKKVAVD